MSKLAKLIGAPILGVALFASASVVSAATVTFSGFSSSEEGLFELPGTDPITGTNLLNFNDYSMLPAFSVTANGLEVVDAFDTLSFDIWAPAGYVITKVKYKEGGTASVVGQGLAQAKGSVVFNGKSNSMGLLLLTAPTEEMDWTLGATKSYALADNVNKVSMSITNSILAAAFGGNEEADWSTVSKNLASVEVTLTAVPLPPAAWMLGSALIGLATVGRRKLGT